MGHAKTTIELNGKRYDAATGVVLSSDRAPQPTTTPSRPGSVVDGFFRKPGAHTIPAAKPAVVKPTVRTPVVPSVKPGHRPTTAKTLMRHAVSKPKAQVQTASKPAAPQSIVTHNDRLARAHTVPKSQAISRFDTTHRLAVKTKLAPLAVQAPPIHHTPVSHVVPSRPVAQATAPTNPFDEALQKASSHTQPALQKPKLHHRTAQKIGVSSRVVSLAASSLAIILLVGFIAYQNVPNISMRLAATQAGFHASYPGYTPSGFGMNGPIKAAPGAVTISFRSHSDNRRFEISQRASNWNSDSLLNNYVVTTKSSYQAVQDKGKTIYFYGNNNATWVNGGVWYRVAGNGNLSSDQLVHIADSL